MVSKILQQAFGSQLRRNMSSGVAAMGVNFILLAVSYPIYLYFVGYEKYDIWLVLTAVLGFAQLGMLGINHAVVKLVAEEYAKNNIRGVQSYLMMALAMLMCTGTIALLVILFFKSQIIAAFRLSGENAELVSWLLPYIGVLTIYVFLVQTLNATLSGLGRMDLSNYILIAGRVTAVCTAVLLLWRRGLGIESLLIGNAFSYIVVHILSLVFIHQQAKMRFLRPYNWSWSHLKGLLSFGSGIFGGSLLQILLDPFNKMMLSRYGQVGAITVYDIAFKGSMQVRSLAEAALRAIMPEISRLGANMTAEAKRRINSINRRALKLAVFAVLPLYGGLFVVAGVLLRFWLGQRFVDTLPYALRVMLVASYISLLGVPAFYTLMGLGRVRHCFISIGVQSFLNATIMVGYAVFAPSMISSRVFLAVAVGMSGATAYLTWQLKRDSHIASKRCFLDSVARPGAEPRQ